MTSLHIPGDSNFLADVLSRQDIDHREWSLHQRVVNCLFKMWNTPVVDLFASIHNKKIQNFCSLLPCQHAVVQDAFTLNWANFSIVYAFPPIVILNRVIAKIRREQARAILIAPNWPQRSWFSQLLYMIVEVPLQLPLWPDLLSQFRICHDNPAKLSLVAWKISGVPSEAEAFRRRLRRQLCRQESPQLGLFTMQGGPNSVIGEVEGVSIPLWPLFQ